jgi:hypothetical protein
MYVPVCLVSCFEFSALPEITQQFFDAQVGLDLYTLRAKQRRAEKRVEREYQNKCTKAIFEEIKHNDDPSAV